MTAFVAFFKGRLIVGLVGMDNPEMETELKSVVPADPAPPNERLPSTSMSRLAQTWWKESARKRICKV
jgi:hypothetical protein